MEDGKRCSSRFHVFSSLFLAPRCPVFLVLPLYICRLRQSTCVKAVHSTEQCSVSFAALLYPDTPALPTNRQPPTPCSHFCPQGYSFHFVLLAQLRYTHREPVLGIGDRAVTKKSKIPVLTELTYRWYFWPLYVQQGLCVLRCAWFFATPWTAAIQAPLSMEFSRQEHWSGLPFPSPGDLPDQTYVSCIGRQIV